MTEEDVKIVLSEAGVHETWFRNILQGLSMIIRPSRRPDIVVCNSCELKGGHEKCNRCNYGDLFQ